MGQSEHSSRFCLEQAGEDSPHPARLFRHLDRSDTSQGKAVPAWYGMGRLGAVSTARVVKKLIRSLWERKRAGVGGLPALASVPT